MNEVAERLRAYHRYGWKHFQLEQCIEDQGIAADELDRYRKATGGLDPALVAKALAATARSTSMRWWFTADEYTALRAATFEVTE